MDGGDGTGDEKLSVRTRPSSKGSMRQLQTLRLVQRGAETQVTPFSPEEDQIHPIHQRRGWLLRRLLLGADLIGLATAYLITEGLFTYVGHSPTDRVSRRAELLVFLALLPVWVGVAHLAGLYDRDSERNDHSTVDDLVGVFNVLTAGTWLVYVTAWVTKAINPGPSRLLSFWALAIGCIVLARAGARSVGKRTKDYMQNTVIVGAGHVGQLVARKVMQHPEYGINLLGFVDALPRERRPDLGTLTLLGDTDDIQALVQEHEVERVIIAFSNDSHETILELVRRLEGLNVQIDVVPRLFEIVGPKVTIHSIESLPLVGIPPTNLPRSAKTMKRLIDIVVASVTFVLLLPLFLYIAIRVKLDSPGPIFFRQERVGGYMRTFTTLKFRTMYVNTDPARHQAYIATTLSSASSIGENGLYKLSQTDSITPFGAWLRKTSLDELPQLINVIRGDMSLVGPRPCIPYEIEHFTPHQFVRFAVPAGVTGLWQVTARARSSFGEALEMDTAYVRGWSLGLDFRLLCRTPLAVLRQRGGTA